METKENFSAEKLPDQIYGGRTKVVELGRLGFESLALALVAV